MDNLTKIKCDEQTVGVLQNFMNEYMGEYTCHVDASMELISQHQQNIRLLVEPYMKEHLDYLKNIRFKNGEFYSIFMIFMAIDVVKIYNWGHICELLSFKYNGKDTINKYGMTMRDDYYDLTEYNDACELSDLNCCCGKRHIHARLTTKICNGNYTFLLGSECIKKTCITYYEKKSSMVRKNDKRKKELLEKEELKKQGVKFCKTCEKRLPIINEYWKKECLKCWKRKKGF
jgi:hypothetical protein